MNIASICKEVMKFQSDSIEKPEFIADKFVKDGYGQSCGGYLSGISVENAENITQAQHFLGYYGDKGEKLPSFQYLRCPQLLLFIAELVGVSKEALTDACKTLERYEVDNGLNGTGYKNGNYIWGKQVFRDFKSMLKINDVTKVIKISENWDTALKEVKELFKVV